MYVRFSRSENTLMHVFKSFSEIITLNTKSREKRDLIWHYQLV